MRDKTCGREYVTLDVRNPEVRCFCTDCSPFALELIGEKICLSGDPTQRRLNNTLCILRAGYSLRMAERFRCPAYNTGVYVLETERRVLRVHDDLLAMFLTFRFTIKSWKVVSLESLSALFFFAAIFPQRNKYCRLRGDFERTNLVSRKSVFMDGRRAPT